MCVGSHLANRELYTAFIRLLVSFEILPAVDTRHHPILDDALAANAHKTSLTLDPYPFKVGFRVRDRASLEGWIAESEARTAHL